MNQKVPMTTKTARMMSPPTIHPRYGFRSSVSRDRWATVLSTGPRFKSVGLVRRQGVYGIPAPMYP